jgi:release factor family 3
MDRIRKSDLHQLLDHQTGPCVSIYLALTPAGRDSRADEVRLRELADEAEHVLMQRGMRRPDAAAFVEPIRRYPDDIERWQHRGRALALFAAPNFFQTFHCDADLDDALFVDDWFHVLPLLPLVSDAERYFVLALSTNAVRLLEGDADGLREVGVPELPKSLDAALNIDTTDRGEQVHSGQRGAFGKQSAVFHGQGGKPDRMKADLKSYIRVVADVIDRRLNGQSAPLVLATVEETVPHWRSVSRYKHTLADFAAGNPDYLTPAQLHAKVWPLVQPALNGHRQSCERRLLAAKGEKVTSDLRDIVPAAKSGRVAALFIDCRRSRWGRYDAAHNAAVLHAEREDGDQDLAELAVVETLRHGGDVFDLRPEQGGAGEAAEALLRF